MRALARKRYGDGRFIFDCAARYRTHVRRAAGVTHRLELYPCVSCGSGEIGLCLNDREKSKSATQRYLAARICGCAATVLCCQVLAR
jgi:hypothetical protein